MGETPRKIHGSETRQRGKRPAMRCSDAEFAQLEVAAKRAGMTVGSFMRLQCLGTAGPRAVRVPPVDQSAMAYVLAHIGKMGSNHNQIAYKLNALGLAAPDELAIMIDEGRAIYRVLMDALGKAPRPASTRRKNRVTDADRN